MIATAVLMAALAAMPVLAQSAAEKPKAATGAPKSYIPGLEQFMGTIQRQHAKLWLAAKARNWELAAYQLGELKEVMSDVQDLVPDYKTLPIGQMIDAVTTGPIAELEKAVDARDGKAFAAGFDMLTASCNSCHDAAGRGFIVIRRPTRSTFTNQVFEPRK